MRSNLMALSGALRRLAALGMILALCSAAAEASYRVVAISGDAAPGVDRTFVSFGSPVINAGGEVAFRANLSGPASDVFPHGAWSSSPLGLQPLAIAGQGAPDVDDGRYRTPGPPQILTDAGETLFYGQLVDEGDINFDNDYGIWAGASTGMQLVSRKSSPVPGLPDGVNYSLFIASPRASGMLGLSASLQGAGVDDTNGSAAFVGRMTPANSLQLIARAGDAAPGMPAGWQFRGLGAPNVNALGALVMSASVSEGGNVFQQLPGVWAGAPDDLRRVAVASSAAPDVDGRTFSYFGEPRINNAGHILFTGYLNADSVEEQLSDTGIWVGSVNGTELSLLTMEGGAAPGYDTSVYFRGSVPGEEPYYRPFSEPVLASNGQVAFSGTVYGEGVNFENNDGIWLSEPISPSTTPLLSLLAREGDAAPGTPDGTVFIGQNFGEDLIPAFERPLINASGQIAFAATTAGPLDLLGYGIWATDRSDDLQLIAHTGLELELAPGDVRIVEQLQLLSGGSSDDGFQSAFNDAGQLSFGVRFTDGSEAIMVTSVVPEPSTICLLFFAVAGAAITRRTWYRDQGSTPR